MQRFVNADILKGEITNSATLNRYAYANGNPVSNIDPLGLSADERGTNISSAYKIADEQYKQILNSSFNHKLKKLFSPNRDGYSDLYSTNQSDLQLFTTSKYEKSILREEGFYNITYVFVTLSVSEWSEYVHPVDLYSDNLSNVLDVLVSIRGAYADEKFSPNNPSELISIFFEFGDIWAKENLNNVVIGDFERYISNSISGKDSSDKVSILIEAYQWRNSKKSFTNEWHTELLATAYPWSDEVKYPN